MSTLICRAIGNKVRHLCGFFFYSSNSSPAVCWRITSRQLFPPVTRVTFYIHSTTEFKDPVPRIYTHPPPAIPCICRLRLRVDERGRDAARDRAADGGDPPRPSEAANLIASSHRRGRTSPTAKRENGKAGSEIPRARGPDPLSQHPAADDDASSFPSTRKKRERAKLTCLLPLRRRRRREALLQPRRVVFEGGILLAPCGDVGLHRPCAGGNGNEM